MAFEVFKETGTRTKVFISVTERKSFGLSRAFLDKHHISKDQKAVILFDKDTNRFALHFSSNNPDFGFAIRIANEKHGAAVVAKSFFDLKQIDVKRYAGRYSEYEVLDLKSLGIDKDGTAYVIQLKESPDKTGPEVDESDDELQVDDEPIDLSNIPF